MEYICLCSTPLGTVTLASDGDALTGLWFDGQKHFARTLEAQHETRMLPIFESAACWLDLYFSGKIPDFMPPLAPKGTLFQLSVWNALLRIPRGETTTYGEIARRIAAERGLSSMSAQAVGGAVGRNPISLFIPCHRVVGAGMGGYAGGIWRKQALLALERDHPASAAEESFA